MMKSQHKVFDQKYINEELFMNLYAQACTRCWGYNLPSTCMIPMADNFNHTSTTISRNVISKDLHHKGKNLDYSYFTHKKFMNDYSQLFGHNESNLFDKDKFNYNFEALST